MLLSIILQLSQNIHTPPQQKVLEFPGGGVPEDPHIKEMYEAYITGIFRGGEEMYECFLELQNSVFTYLNFKKIDKNERKLLEFRKRAVKEQTKLHERKEARENSDSSETAKSKVRLTTRLIWFSMSHDAEKAE